MKYISICSGIEAASVAWEGFGWTPLAFSEIEAFPSTVLAHHYPGVPNLGDMTKFEDWPEEILAQCDILVGGPPCQAFSVAGLRKSLQDERGNVTLAYVRLLNHIDEVRRRHGRPPVVAVYENVPGLLSTKDNAFGCLIGALCGCDEAPETETGKWPKAGFLCGEARRVGYRVLDAQFFGVAQRRRRIFLIAVPCELVERLGGRACPSEILSLRESMRGNPPTRGEAWQGVARSTSKSLTSSGRGVERCGESRGQDDVVLGKPRQSEASTTTVVAFTKSKRAQSTTDDESWVPGEVTPTMSCFDQGDTRATTVVAFKPGQSEAAGAFFATQDFSPTIQSSNNGSTAVPAVAFTTEQTPKFKEDCALTMTKQLPLGGVQPQCVAFSERTRDCGSHLELEQSDVVPAVRTGVDRQQGIVTAMAVRRLTPRECERLQGFPDDYTLVTYRGKPACDGPRYRALGNSMAVPCMWWIGMRIKKATEQE